MWRNTLAIVAAMLIASGTALAAEKPSFNEADANGDEKVSIKEATNAGVPKEEAKSNDLDDNGKLAKSDWKFVDMETPDESSGDAY